RGPCCPDSPAPPTPDSVSFPGDVMDGDVQAMAAEIQALRDEVARLTAENATLRAAAAVAAPPPPPPVPALQLRRCPVKPPAKFDGNRDHFAAFRAQCGLYMRMRPEDFPNEQVRVGFVINQLTGPAAQWATMRLLADDPLLNDCQAFLTAMGRFFGAELRQEMATREVRRLRQGKQSVVDYTIKFQLLMHDLCWNEEALMAQYREGLRGEILDALARTPPPQTLDDLMRTCLQIDSRLEERKLERKSAGSLFSLAATPATPQAAFSPPPASCFPEPEPMQLGATRFYLPKAEMDRRRAAGLCFTCGQKGHLAQACPWNKSAENYQSR
uniref:CCHC-type domain-containing protein n=1 Tax=Varanus komodoensis TaxID=61221 RepID=A0A8D2LBW3_VARKO